ncbi:hypothetical protein [Chitinophaga pinensis]|uniref:hypothetical protein n=1 Tax=Chitinophaga pinensis TaxID=79329 RepID=UPI001C99529F|nr:hypothetical protein [Chitinophaga pinensis]
MSHAAKLVRRQSGQEDKKPFIPANLRQALSYRSMSKEEKHIVILVPSNSALMDMAGPMEVFSRAAAEQTKMAHHVQYIVHTISGETTRQVVTSSFLPILCEATLKR